MPTAQAPQAAVATVALIGNPNTGKTTLFNALTGLTQRVANFPGVTVERKVGRVSLGNGLRLDLLDLPGTYSLSAHSPDEVIAVDVLLGRQQGTPAPTAVIAVVDASNLRRNLYLVSQLVEMGLPVVVALNMVDVAESRGVRIDARALSQRLGVPVVPLCAHRRVGLAELRGVLSELAAGTLPPAGNHPSIPSALSQPVEVLRCLVERGGGPDGRLSSLEALRALVDEDGAIEKRLRGRLPEGFAGELARLRVQARQQAGGAPLSAVESGARYAWVDAAVAGCVQWPEHMADTRSDRVDRWLTHRLVGTLVFVAICAVVFQAIYTWSAPAMDTVDGLFAALATWAEGALPAGALRSLLVDGIIAGVGGVLVFLPQIAVLFFFISVLEDCGYMARAALLMDRLLTVCGLSGKSFIPLLSSYACAVPGIMAARTIEDRRDRITTILVAPLMSCSARLPVYILFIAAFVPDRPLLGSWVNLQGVVLLALYSMGTLLAVPVAWLLKRSVLRGVTPPFLLELPSYKWPSPRTVLLRVYHSGRAFVVRAGSIILATTVVMWALAYFPRDERVAEHYARERQAVSPDVQGEARQAALSELERREAADLLEASLLGRAGHRIEPLVAPLGWDWRIGMATLASFPAREVVISALGTIYSLGGDQDEGSADLRTTLKRARHSDGSLAITLAVALSVMVFFALCAQCMSTLVTIQRETASWRWAGLAFAYMTGLAYAGSFFTYRAALALGWGG
ncbi:MAG: ferrous iron transport protein B [Candidatus Latescibacterota bacterium]